MLSICPHCEKPGLAVSPRSYYSRGWPAVCRACGGLSYDRSFWRVTAYSLLEWAAPLFLFAIVFLPGLLRLVGLLVLFGMYLIWRRRRRHPPVNRFRPVTPARSLLARRLTYLGLLLTAASIVTAFAVSWHRR